MAPLCVGGRRGLGAARSSARQVVDEPASGKTGDSVERPWLFEEVARVLDDRQLALASKVCISLAIEIDDAMIFSADDEQGWGRDPRERLLREIGTSSARDDRLDPIGALGRRDDRRRGAGARAKETDVKVAKLRLYLDPADDSQDAIGEQANVEA